MIYDFVKIQRDNTIEITLGYEFDQYETLHACSRCLRGERKTTTIDGRLD